VEELLIGVIDAGVNELTSLTFQTSRLKEVRADARRRAVSAAREKAEIYAAAAGVALGEVRAIEDVNPDRLTGPDGLRGRLEVHSQREPEIDDTGDITAIDPGAITVGAAVVLLFAIKNVNTN